MNVKISVTGVDEIDSVLKNLPKELTHRVLSAAHANAAKPLVTRMKLTAPEGPTGNLVDSIGIVKLSSKKTEEGAVRVGPRRGRFKGNHAHWVEFGIKKERELKGRGKYKAGTRRGTMPAQPFVEPAFRQTKDEVERGIKVSLGKTLARTMKKHLRK